MAISTIPGQFLYAVETYRNPSAFRQKRDGRYVDMSHEEAMDRVYHAALALQSLKLAKGDRIALLSENRVEWALADLAILSSSCINVPVYATLPGGQVEYILRDSEARAIFVSTQEQLHKVLELRSRLPMLQHIITFDEIDAEGVISFDALIARGQLVDDKPPFRSLIDTIGKYDWASIIYTSGTTGDPKGVIMTHWNFMSNVHAALQVIPITSADSCLSFLPLSHVFERTAGYYAMMAAGASIAYAESVETVADNLIEIRPTIVCSVPRLYEKMYARILDKVEEGSNLKQSLFHWAVGVGQKYVTENLSGGAGALTKSKQKIANALVFKKLKARTGGRLRFFVSGGAPLSRSIAEFFHAAGIPILEGYGLTETAPVLAANTFDHFKFGTVGKPFPGVEIKIAEDGEILARGDNVMPGYYKKPEQTAEVLIDGWFHTGDIGHLDQDGYLVITDRKKDIIVTAGGKNVAPQPIENMLKQSPFIAEAILIGDRRRFISAVIVPDFEKLQAWAAEEGMAGANHVSLVTNEKVIALFQEEMDRQTSSLASYEHPHKFCLLDRELTIESGELTPSMKVKRRVIESKFKENIDTMYAGV